jgi:hypothetical protein
MDSSSPTSRDSTAPSEGGSTLKGNASKKDKALNWERLRLRRVSKIATEDEKSEYIRSKLVSEPVRLQFKDTRGLQSILRDFLKECETSRPNKDSYAAIEDLSNKINEWKPGHRLASITNRDFEIDIAHSKSSNEAVIQRTVMISIIDRWQLHDLFVFNCEGQWKAETIHLVPVTGRMLEVTLPKPDLAIFFKLSALTGSSVWAPYPNEISRCLRPDGGDERCFPFFFMEVKRAADNLESAFRANLLSASQALYNIFIWMDRAGQQKDFFDHVRIFTMDLNAQEIHLRMHRAVRDEENFLTYQFTDIASLVGYNKDQACHLVRNVLMEYAEKELHGILKSTFQEVSQQERKLAQAEVAKQQIKRKADAATSQASKKSRSRPGSAVPALPRPATPALPGPVPSDTTSSFGASALEISSGHQSPVAAAQLT